MGWDEKTLLTEILNCGERDIDYLLDVLDFAEAIDVSVDVRQIVEDIQSNGLLLEFNSLLKGVFDAIVYDLLGELGLSYEEIDNIYRPYLNYVASATNIDAIDAYLGDTDITREELLEELKEELGIE